MPNKKAIYCMSEVVTDKERVREVVERGVESVYPNKELLMKKLSSGERIRLYCGFDPTAPALHIGNAIALLKLAQFQALGHEVIFLVGDFTGLIGDPTGKKAVRRQLTSDEITENARHYKEQASAYLNFTGDNPAQILFNSAWSRKLNLEDLINLSANFTVQQMIQRDMFQVRLKEEKPIYLHEFLYPLLQANDSLVMDVDLEVGGNDQMFNMMCGRDLLKAVKGKEKFVLTMKLLADANGQKMGKTEGNAVFLDNSAEEMYGKVMSWPDEVINSAFELCTTVSQEELAAISGRLKQGDNPRDLKARLAWEISSLNHGPALADTARAKFVSTFQKKEIPVDMATWQAKKSKYNIVDLLIETGLADSKNEGRRLIEQGAIKIQEGGEFVVVKDVKLELGLKMETVISRGKRQFVRVTR